MPAAPIPNDEATRLMGLQNLAILDTNAEVHFDGIVAAAAATMCAPIALISLIDTDRQWFKARFGLETTQTNRCDAFCAHAIMSDEPLIVTDAHQDTRFADNPLVLSAPNFRSYVGIPLRISDGSRVGTLCVLDFKPRQWDGDQIELLKGLAKAVCHFFDTRRSLVSAQEIALQLAMVQNSRQIDTEMLEDVGKLANVGGWTIDLQTNEVFWSHQTRMIHEVDDDFVPDMQTSLEFYGLADRAIVAATLNKAIKTGERGELELPLLTAKGRTIWVRAFGRVVTKDGILLRLVGGLQDITEEISKRHELEEVAANAQRALSDLSAYQMALDQHAIVATTDANGQILFVNDRFCEVSGYDRSELIGRNQGIVNSTQQPKQFFTDMWNQLNGGQS
jgi:PAS domain-containing protein